MEENMIVIRDPKTVYFYFDWPKDVDENLKHETCEIEQLLLKHKRENNIHEHGKQQNE